MNSVSVSRFSALIACALAAACSSPPPAGNVGTGDGTDAGSSSDAGSNTDNDAGPTGSDAGSNSGTDAGSNPGTDAGSNPGTDAGPTTTDAGPTATDAGPGGPTPTAGVIKTVFIILMENQNWYAYTAARAPYINSILLPQASYATNYKNPTGIHPSEPNYLWLEAGTNFGIAADGVPANDIQGTTQHLVTLLENAGHTWKSYQEDIDGSNCPLSAVNNYAPKHNPMVYFKDVTNNNDASSAHCKQHVRPYSELATDLQNGTVAQYNFITPNLCDDGHNDCGTSPNALDAAADEVPQVDTWLKNNVPGILSSSAYRNGGALFITWDESEFDLLKCFGSDCPIGMIVLSPHAKGGGHTSSTAYDHSSTLRTMEEIFGLSQPYLGGAATATDLSDLFAQFP